MVREICMIENFIMPSLVDERFGHLLEWVDEEEKIFKVFWSHMSRKTWSKKYFAVFLAWDRIKGRINDSDPEFFTKSKGRFRSALNRLSICGKLIKLKSTIVGYKMYKLQDVTLSPVHVPEMYVEIPLSPTLSSPFISLYDAEIHPEEMNKNNASNAMHTNFQIEECVNYYEHLPDEISYSLDDINGELLMQESLNFPDFILTENVENQISDAFLNEMQDDFLPVNLLKESNTFLCTRDII